MGKPTWMPFSCCVLLCSSVHALTVGTLSNHDPTAWDRNSNCSTRDDRALVDCNLRVYEAAMAAANGLGQAGQDGPQPDLVLFPEGYALAGAASASTFLEPLLFNVSDNPCLHGSSDVTPLTFGLSCLARRYAMGVAGNVFTLDSVTKKAHITEIFFDSVGTISAIYHKNHLFVTETRVFTPGPFKPTAFDFAYGANQSVRLGVAICYEGFYPSVTGDWKQFDDLKRQNTSVLLWSIGADFPFVKEFSMNDTARQLATKYHYSVAASIDGALGVAFNAGGAAAEIAASVPIAAPHGYTAKQLLLQVHTHVDTFLFD